MMEGNDHLKWMIGDMAFQIAHLEGKTEQLEAEVKRLKEALPKEPEAK
jgi:hypothetical protein